MRNTSPLTAALAVAFILLALVLSAGCGGGNGEETSDADGSAMVWQGEPREVDGLLLPARVQGPEIALATADGFSPRFWPGVNVGATIPGTSPGEVSARAEQYQEWFPEMADLGIRVLRIYTLLDPSFYSELAAYNEEHEDDPLYVIHGIWIPEEQLLASEDLWSEQLLSEQRRLTDEVYAAASGEFVAPERLGEASGTWETDIREWIIGWSFGIELDPNALTESQKRNPPRAWNGRFISTNGRASSTEAWLARQLDYLASLDAEGGWSRPITFTNWLTLDPLDHPLEPLESEDSISVDAKKLQAGVAWPAGFFASYHVYPYYPDFLRWEYEDAADPYAAYLRDLRRHHGTQAVMVTEFGVPSSLGKAHLGLKGRDQGGHDERQAMAMNADMLQLIASERYAGGIVFQWIDEWFKLTWNTVDLELPSDRRQMWRNALTNEEHFGIWAAEARLEDQVTIDGSDEEWEAAEAPSQAIWEAADGVQQIRAASDEAYLYLTLRFAEEEAIDGSVIGLDVRNGDNDRLPWLQEARMANADVAVRLTDRGIQIRKAAWTDELAALYGIGLDIVDVKPDQLEQGSGSWRAPQLILNRPYSIPTTGRERPTELQDLGEHPWSDEAVSSLAIAGRDDSVVELRLPWALLGFSDPSTRTLVEPQPDGTVDSVTLEDDRELLVEVFSADGTEIAGEAGFNWEAWQTVEWSERPKAGIEQLEAAFRETGAR